MTKRYGKAAECATFVKRTMPYTKASFAAAEEWLDASGVGEVIDPDDGDAVLASLAEAFHRFAAAQTGSKSP